MRSRQAFYKNLEISIEEVLHGAIAEHRKPKFYGMELRGSREVM